MCDVLRAHDVTWVIIVVEVLSPPFNNLSMRSKLFRRYVGEAISFDSLCILVAHNCRTMLKMIIGLVLEPLDWFNIRRSRSSHEVVWLQAFLSVIMNAISLVIIIFEYLPAELLVRDFAVSGVRSTDQSLNVIGLRNVVHSQFLMELVWTHVSSSQALDGVAEILLLLVRESSLSTQMNI